MRSRGENNGLGIMMIVIKGMHWQHIDRESERAGARARARVRERKRERERVSEGERE